MTADLANFGAPRVRRLLGATYLVPLAASMMLAGPALAQDAAPAAPAAGTAPTQLASAADSMAPADTAAGEIVVTGSRLGGGFTAPTPVTTVGAAQIQARGITAVSELLQEVPQLRINQNIGKSSEPVGQSCVDLRGLNIANSSCPRTLVLLDGRRIAATSPFGGIDTNIFPVSLISNVDVVTGGASAAYGSDAVAGVVNFQINKTLEGFKADVSYGESKYSDFKRPVVSAAVGKSFLDNRLHLELAGDYYRNSGQTAQAARPWGRNKTVLISNPQSATNGLPATYIADNAYLSYMTFGGVIAVSPFVASPSGLAALRGLQFIPGGTTTFRYGNPIGNTYAVGGDGASVEDDGNILPLIRRWSGYGRASYEVSDNVTVWGDFLYSRVKVNSDLAPNVDAPTINTTTGAVSGGITIQRNNAYLPANVRALMFANNLTSFVMGRLNMEDGYSQNNSISRVERFAGGIEGHFGKWNWDFTAQRSANYFRQDSVNNRIQNNWFFGLDTVYYNPATNAIFDYAGGATTPPAGYVLTCRANVPGASFNTAAAGCVPINPFGAGSISQSALNYYRGTSYYYAHQHQNVFSLNLKGSPFATWAGDVQLAVGGEYREEGIAEVSDAISVARGWRSINQQPLSGSLNVKEIYGEIAIPLAKDWVLAKDLELNGAIRYADYSTSGGVTTFKVGVNYTPVTDIRFRGTYSRDIRAANINELFSGQNQVITPLNDVRAGAPSPSYNITQLNGGNPNLKPEKADTYSFGAVLQPTFLPGFHASIDYYSIKLKDAIGTIPPNQVIANCAAGQANYCALLTVNSANAITSVQATLVNAQKINTSGIDFEARYTLPVNVLGRPGDVTLRGLANYVHKLTVDNGTIIDHVADLGNPDAGGVPEWRYNFDLTYSGGPLKLGLYYRYISGGRFGIPPSSFPSVPSQQKFSSRQYVDASISYKITRNLELYGKVDNIFNRFPPVVPNSITQPTVANAQMYDKIGRYFVGGVRVNF